MLILLHESQTKSCDLKRSNRKVGSKPPTADEESARQGLEQNRPLVSLAGGVTTRRELVSHTEGNALEH